MTSRPSDRVFCRAAGVFALSLATVACGSGAGARSDSSSSGLAVVQGQRIGPVRLREPMADVRNAHGTGVDLGAKRYVYHKTLGREITVSYPRLQLIAVYFRGGDTGRYRVIAVTTRSPRYSMNRWVRVGRTITTAAEHIALSCGNAVVQVGPSATSSAQCTATSVVAFADGLQLGVSKGRVSEITVY